MDIFCPTEKDDLAVHPKKLQELEQWLLEASRSKKKLAILTGPPGCGKTASIRVLANKNGFYIQEWSNCTENKLRFDGEVEWQSEELHFSQSDAFKNFLFKASRYGSVLEPHNKRRIILIEDLPNAIQKDFNTYYTIFTYVYQSILVFENGLTMSIGIMLQRIFATLGQISLGTNHFGRQ